MITREFSINKTFRKQIIKRIYIGLGFLFGLIVFGALGYMLLENLEPLDAIYMTIISITTTGFQEVKPLDHAGRIWTMFVIISGVLIVAFLASQVAELVIQIRGFRRFKMEKRIQELKNHCIVCGYGRMGSRICEELKNQDIPFVVIESNPDIIEHLEQSNYLFVEGDATQDEILLQAGIKKAKNLITVLSDDASNVFTVLSARNLNPKLHIVARAIEENTISKLEKAGANRVVAAFEIGAFRMAYELLHPGVIDFIDLVFRGKHLQLQLEEIQIPERSILAGKMLSDTPIRKDLNILVVLIIRAQGDMVYNPAGDTILLPGDRMICIGEFSNLKKLGEMIQK
jgi:voltage-gated potassium channel